MNKKIFRNRPTKSVPKDYYDNDSYWNDARDLDTNPAIEGIASEYGSDTLYDAGPGFYQDEDDFDEDGEFDDIMYRGTNERPGSNMLPGPTERISGNWDLDESTKKIFNNILREADHGMWGVKDNNNKIIKKGLSKQDAYNALKEPGYTMGIF
jgi:hypothetical protein